MNEIKNAYNRLITKKINRMEISSKDEALEKFKNNYISVNYKQYDFFLKNMLYLKKNGEYVFDVKNYLHNIATSSKNIFKWGLDIKPLNPLNTEFLEAKDKTLANKQFSKVKYLEYKNEDKTHKVFLTLTCPAMYHQSSKKFGFETLGTAVEESFKFQKKVIREIYKEFKKTLKRKNIDVSFNYIRIIELHKSLTAHSHSLFYLTEEQNEILQRIYLRITAKYKMEQTKYLLIQGAKTSTYIAKYLIKTMKDDSDDNSYNEVKRFYSNHRIFVASNYQYTTQEQINIVYNHLKINRPKLFDRFQKSKVPLYVNIEKYILKNIDISFDTKEMRVADHTQTRDFIDGVLLENNLQISKENYEIIIKELEQNIKNKKSVSKKQVQKMTYKDNICKKLHIEQIIYDKEQFEIEEIKTNIFDLQLRGKK